MKSVKNCLAMLLLSLSSTAAFAVTDAQVFAFAEANYPSLFSGTATTGVFPPYNYRYYPTTGNYLAVDTAGEIFILGPYTGNVITSIGLSATYANTITAWESTQASTVTPQTTFATADLAGTWDRHFIKAGRTFTNMTTGAITSWTNKWEHGVEIWDANGNFTEISGAWSEAGPYVLNSGTQALSADGTFTDLAAQTAHGTMSANKDLIVATKTTNNLIDPALVIFMKRNPTVTFTTADLAGTWDRHFIKAGRTFTDITTGAITSTTSKWEHGVEIWDANGNFTEISGAWSEAGPYVLNSGTQALSADGTFTDLAAQTAHGIMSANKDLIVATKTTNNLIDPALVIFMKRNPTVTFTTADLAGTWDSHFIKVGRTFTDVGTGSITHTNNRWERGVETWDASGNFTQTSGAWSDTAPYVLRSGTQALSADGTFTSLTDPTVHGTMSASKDLIVVTKTGGNSMDVLLGIFQKRR